MMRNNFW